MRLILPAIGLALATVEGTAWWWTHPAASDEEPVLAYERRIEDRGSKMEDEDAPPIQKSTIPNLSRHSSDATADPQSSISSSLISASQHFSVSASTHTPLPELYAKSAPMLRCTGGQVFHVRFDDSIGVHCAFFEWDGTDTGSVFEAYRHMPEACLGSLGMKLVSKEKPISYQVGRNAIEQSGDSSSANPPSAILDPPSPSSGILLFDHTVFRDPGQGGGPLAPGAVVHAFRAVWVSGFSEADSRKGFAGDGMERLRTIRMKSAVSRFRPTHARVIQGAVRGALNREAAWSAFEQAMLRDLTLKE